MLKIKTLHQGASEGGLASYGELGRQNFGGEVVGGEEADQALGLLRSSGVEGGGQRGSRAGIWELGNGTHIIIRSKSSQSAADGGWWEEGRQGFLLFSFYWDTIQTMNRPVDFLFFFWVEVLVCDLSLGRV